MQWKQDVTIHSAYFEGNDTSETAEKNIKVENEHSDSTNNEDYENDNGDRKVKESDIDINNEDINGAKVSWNDENIQHVIVASAVPFYVADGKRDNPKQHESSSRTFNNEVHTNKQGQKTKHDVIKLWQNEKHGRSFNIEDQTCKQGQAIKQGTFHQQGFTTANISNKFYGDTDVFDMFGSDFKEELAVNNDKLIKSDALDFHLSGPFNNVKTKQTHYVVVFKSFGKTWTLKDSFLCTYLHMLACRMNSMEKSSIDVDHSQSYYELNIKSMSLKPKVFGIN